MEQLWAGTHREEEPASGLDAVGKPIGEKRYRLHLEQRPF